MSLTADLKDKLRKRDHKKAYDSESAKRDREKTTVQLRKDKRDEVMNKKRRNILGDDQMDKEVKAALDQFGSSSLEALKAIKQKFEKQETVFEGLKMLDQLLMSADDLVGGDGDISHLKRVIQTIIDNGWYKPMSNMLMQDSVPIEIRLVVSSIFANMMTGSHNQIMLFINNCSILVVIAAAMQKYKTEPAILDNLLFSLQNIVNEDEPKNTVPRDAVIQHIGFKHILSIWYPEIKIEITRRLLALLLDIVKLPGLSYDHIQVLFEPCIHFVSHMKEDKALFDSLRLLSRLCGSQKGVHLSDEEQTKRVSAIIRYGGLAPVSKLLLHPSHNVSEKAMHLIGNLVGGSDQDTIIVLKSGVLDGIAKMLFVEAEKKAKSSGSQMNDAFLKEACWLLSNSIPSSDGKIEYCRAVIEQYQKLKLVEPLMLLALTGRLGVQEDVAHMLCNWIDNGTDEQIEYLLHVNTKGNDRPTMMNVLCHFLRVADTEFQDMVLRIFNALILHDLKVHKSKSDPTYVITSLEENGAIDDINRLINSENEDVAELATTLIDGFLSEEARNEDDEMFSRPGEFKFGDRSLADADEDKDGFGPSISGFGPAPSASGKTFAFGSDSGSSYGVAPFQFGSSAQSDEKKQTFGFAFPAASVTRVPQTPAQTQQAFGAVQSPFAHPAPSFPSFGAQTPIQSPFAHPTSSGVSAFGF